jgi:hypothetical protein
MIESSFHELISCTDVLTWILKATRTPHGGWFVPFRNLSSAPLVDHENTQPALALIFEVDTDVPEQPGISH